jgi:hypothetical protein
MNALKLPNSCFKPRMELIIALAQIGIRRVRHYAREAVGNGAAGASSSLHFAVEWALLSPSQVCRTRMSHGRFQD